MTELVYEYDDNLEGVVERLEPAFNDESFVWRLDI